MLCTLFSIYEYVILIELRMDKFSEQSKFLTFESTWNCGLL